MASDSGPNLLPGYHSSEVNYCTRGTMTKTAILIDGNYYLHRAKKLWGEAAPEKRASELHEYALRHIDTKRSKRLEYGDRSLYRIFYYDCPPLDSGAFKQPWSSHNTVFSKKNPSNIWMSKFQSELGGMRKVAMRMGEIRSSNAHYTLKQESLSRLMRGEIAATDLGPDDFTLVGIKQSGVDMRIGLDVASLSFGGIVDQIVLIAGDSDFLPVAKAARRAGVDFLIDPMGHNLPKGLVVETDGVEDLTSECRRRKRATKS